MEADCVVWINDGRYYGKVSGYILKHPEFFIYFYIFFLFLNSSYLARSESFKFFTCSGASFDSSSSCHFFAS
jgi:hypothetical protein